MSIKERVLAGEKLDDLGIVDAHMHMNQPPFYVPSSDWESVLVNMDKYGIAFGLAAPQLAITCDMVLGNDQALEIAGHTERLKAYCSISPHFPDLIGEEMERCFEKGAVGIKIHPSIHQVNADDERYDPVYAFAEKHGTIVLAHSWGQSGLASPDRFAKAAERFPKVNILLGHTGGDFAGMRAAIKAIKARPDNLFADLTGSMQYLRQVEILCREVGPRRVVYGSDSPWLEPGQTLGAVFFADIPDEEKMLILGGNIKRLLGMD
ncbi:amidohydrolase family protein [Planctomycetota bacterium]